MPGPGFQDWSDLKAGVGIKRYGFYETYSPDTGGASWLDETTDGEYVKFEDYERELAAEKARAERLREALKNIAVIARPEYHEHNALELVRKAARTALGATYPYIEILVETDAATGSGAYRVWWDSDPAAHDLFPTLIEAEDAIADAVALGYTPPTVWPVR